MSYHFSLKHQKSFLRRFFTVREILKEYFSLSVGIKFVALEFECSSRAASGCRARDRLSSSRRCCWGRSPGWGASSAARARGWKIRSGCNGCDRRPRSSSAETGSGPSILRELRKFDVKSKRSWKRTQFHLKHKEIIIPANQAMVDSEQIIKYYWVFRWYWVMCMKSKNTLYNSTQRSVFSLGESHQDSSNTKNIGKLQSRGN